MSEKRWNILRPDPSVIDEFVRSLLIHPVTAMTLINRGMTDAKDARRFMSVSLNDLLDPGLLGGMKAALDRVHEAKRKRQKVLVYGDYDVDGVTSSAVLTKALQRMGLETVNFIPHRIKDGYGLTKGAADFARKHNVELMISVDCGISAVDEVNHLKSEGLDVIIIDHHEPGSEIPRADAIINPKMETCSYPFKNLAAVGLVAKLVQALEGKLSEDVLHLTALGTVADVAPLISENRVFVKQGLQSLAQTGNHGLRALMRVAKLKSREVLPYHVGFVLGPRINAAGRMGSAHKALELFMTDDPVRADAIAAELDAMNKDRQQMQRETVQEAMHLIEEDISHRDCKVLVLQKEGWHKGVLGIVAARLTDRFYRPSIVISVAEGVGTASARSINGFHLHDALTQCAGYLEGFGGHKAAAGLTIRREKIDPFRDMINSIAHATIQPEDLIPELTIDAELTLDQIDLILSDEIDRLKPYGEGHKVPVFCSKGVRVKSFPQVLGKDTLKFWVTQNDKSFSVVGFGMGKYHPFIRPAMAIDLAYEIIIDDWNKAPTPQLKLKDLKWKQDSGQAQKEG